VNAVSTRTATYLSVLRALLNVHKALLNVHKALLSIPGALLNTKIYDCRKLAYMHFI